MIREACLDCKASLACVAGVVKFRILSQPLRESCVIIYISDYLIGDTRLVYNDERIHRVAVLEGEEFNQCPIVCQAMTGNRDVRLCEWDGDD